MDTRVNELSLADYQIETEITKHIFRAYDIRGLIGDELTENVYYTIGLAIGALLKQKSLSQILLGFDARLTSESFGSALAAGLQDSGIDVISIGAVPSPVLYFAFSYLNCPSGVMVTGSHNPKEYNGIKIVVDGHNLTDAQIESLYAAIKSRQFVSGLGQFHYTDVIDAYIATIAEQIQLKRKLKVAIDCGNAIAGKFAGKLYRAIGAEVLELFCDVDGRFPNHHPDPSVEENLAVLKQTLLQQGCDIGLAFDGDADRLGVISNTAQVLWPDQQMMLFAKSILSKHPGASIVYDVKCTSLLAQVIKEAGGKAKMCPTGHSIVKKVMRENNAILGGEMSGHLFIKDNWSGFDDALYSGARLLDIIASSSETLAELIETLPSAVSTQELKIEVDEDNKFLLMTQIIDTWQFELGECVMIDGLRWQCEEGWALVRASNTTPYLIVRFEGRDQHALENIQTAFRVRFKALDPNLLLPF